MRLDQALALLEQDPHNAGLLRAAAEAAYDADRADVVADLVARQPRGAAPDPALKNLAGLAAVQAGDPARAQAWFESALADEDAPETRFNLAWSLALLGAWSRVEPLLDAAVLAAAPPAAALRLQALQHLGRLPDAIDVGERALAAGTATPVLLGLLSGALMDAEAPARAREVAERAGDQPDALATLGFLALDAQDLAGAARLFDRALELQPDHARALLGKGLQQLDMQALGPAVTYLDRAAAAFGTHPGSWVTAGWAAFIRGDRAAGRERFQRAADLDPAFAEPHGALAVVAFFDGDMDSAKRQADIALRLDHRCLAGALARSLLLAHSGDPTQARRTQDLALDRPLSPGGRTLREAMGAYARRRPAG